MTKDTLSNSDPVSTHNGELLQISVSGEIHSALDLLVELTGYPRAAFIREALIQQLGTVSLIFPEITDVLKKPEL